MDLAVHCMLNAGATHAEDWRTACVESAQEAGAFFAVGAASRMAQGALGLTTRLVVAPQLCTLLTVCLGSVAASAAARGRDVAPSLDDVARSCACGVFAYAALGGGPRSFAPSHVSSVGAFGARAYSLPAGHAYATAAQRDALAAFGRKVGCHTCGARRFAFIADHQPPLKLAKLRDASWFRFGRTTSQRFYPQCVKCSQAQAVAVRTMSPDVKLHLDAVRPFHLSGLVAAPLARIAKSLGGGPDFDGLRKALGS